MLATLNEIGAAGTPQILVLNKIDQIPGEPDAAALARRILSDPDHQPAGAVAISAATGVGFEALLKKIDETLPLDRVEQCRFRFPIAEGAPLHMVHEHARVTSTKYKADSVEVEAIVPESIRRRLKKYIVVPRPSRKPAD